MNLLLLWTDEQRADTLTAYGNPWGIAPNLDRLARLSSVFANAYCVTPVCTPSRGTILTGLWPQHHGAVFNNDPLRKDARTLPELVAGDYASAYFGKWHLGDEIFAQHGWRLWQNTEDTYHDFYGPERDQAARTEYHHWLVKHGIQPDIRVAGGPLFGRDLVAALPECYSKPRWLADRAIEFVRANAGRPWICALNMLEPHMPFTGPRNGMYDPAELPTDPDWLCDAPRGGLLRTRVMRRIQARKGCCGFDTTSDAAMRRCKANYWGMCSHVDHHMGRVLEALAATGQFDDTLIVFTSDHGDQMGGHGLLAKSVPFEPSTRIPLLIKLPGQKAGHRIEAPVSQIDLAPTLLEGLGENVPAGLDGHSLMDACRGGAEPRRDVGVVWPGDDGRDTDNKAANLDAGFADLGDAETLSRHLAGAHRVLVTPERWKLVLSEFDERELYDLNSDPWELHNLAGDKAQAGRLRELHQRMLAWMRASDGAMRGADMKEPA